MRRLTTRASRTRPVALAALALVAGLAVLSPSPSSATDGHGSPSNPTASAHRARALDALAHARDVLSGTPLARRPAAVRPDASLALRDLFASRQYLTPSARVAADRILARPTSPTDPMGDSYTVSSRKTCGTHVCVHWVPTTADAPPSRSWVDTTLKTMEHVWQREVGELGYRKPASDGVRGGNSKLDVYLKDVGGDGLYGYCTTERTVPGNSRLASGYCVLDDDFARSQFGAAPLVSLRATAAHEFFHAVQFNYDSLEDAWFMEATATWMEEQVYDSVNDNRQYLSASQVAHPGTPLDTFNSYGGQQYGNWAFFEFLGSRFGLGIVKSAWRDASALSGAPQHYSIQAVKSVLSSHGGLTSTYARFVAANTHTSDAYEEGSAWPTAPIARTWTISSDDTSLVRTRTQAIDHLAGVDLRAVPGTGTTGAWRLKVAVNAPDRVTAPAALIRVDRTGTLSTQHVWVPLDSNGNGNVTVPFSSTDVTNVTVSLANASTRYACGQGGYSCDGKPRDDDKSYVATLTALRP